MDNITNINIYTKRMSKSIIDKLFFVDKIFESIENVVDFGCADGELIHVMQSLFPEYNYIGYDISDEMLAIARNKVLDAKFFSSWDEININFSNSLLNISSTIHEVYSYGTEKDINEFWDRVLNSGFKYICIRDMVISEKDYGKTDLAKVEKIYCKSSKNLTKFEEIWGSIKDKKNFIHYLLKYRYIENFEREWNENYLPISLESIMDKVPSNYEIVYRNHYVLPYINYQVKKDFGVDLDTPTHLQLIIKLKINNY